MDFAYASVSSHLLAAILTHNTGQPVLFICAQEVAEPLGIHSRSAAQPVYAPGFEAAHQCRSIRLACGPARHHRRFRRAQSTPNDMAKLGRLYLSGGTWTGRRIVSAEWVRQATRSQVSTHGSGPGDSYGYQWWTTSVQNHHAFAAVGYGGQLVEIVPDLRLVVAVSSDLPGDSSLLDARTFMTMVSNVVVPAIT